MGKDSGETVKAGMGGPPEVCVYVYVTLCLPKEAARVCNCPTYLGMPPIFSLLNHPIDILSRVCGR